MTFLSSALLRRSHTVMDKLQVAHVLNEIGTLLELQGENQFRCNAYHNGARALEQLEGNLAEMVAAKKLGEIPGIGETLQQKITTLVTTGKLEFYDELKQKVPAGLIEMLRIQGMGPKKVKALYSELGIDTLDKLKAACEADRIAALKGFGAKTQQKILEGLAFLDKTGKRFLISEALEIATDVFNRLRDHPKVKRAELCGSLRRRKETIGDLDILVSSSDAKTLMDAFVGLPAVTQVIGHGETKSSVVLANGLNCDLRVVTDEQYPFALHYFTGSKEHNIAIRARAQSYGLKLNEYALEGEKKNVKCKDEADIFAALDLDYIAPELRENTGEIDAAAEHRLPELVEEGDLRGTFHCHTTWSDGKNSLEEMGQAAKKLGLSYLGIGDHSQSLTVANGLTPARVRQQQKEIDALNEKLKGIELLKGTECDILPDGRLDFDDDTLATFDYVVASVHSHFNQTEEEMTSRIVRAVSHPQVTMLGHATGRLLLRREGYKVDLDKVLRAAAEHGTLVEINAHPQRLDLDWIHCKHAKALGVKLVINPDAHATGEIGLIKYGISVARRGWLEKADIVNTQTAAKALKGVKR
jgi:DNA polymerase (family X)